MSTNPMKRAIEKMQEALTLEYTMVHQFPEIAKKIDDSDLKNRIQALLVDSNNHATTISFVLERMGATVRRTTESIPENIDITEFWQRQKEKEQIAEKLHQQSAEFFPDGDPLKEKFNEMVQQERSHIKTVEYIISKLKGGAV
jgi:rubrerythrin